jgi:hypothetical protein
MFTIGRGEWVTELESEFGGGETVWYSEGIHSKYIGRCSSINIFIQLIQQDVYETPEIGRDDE